MQPPLLSVLQALYSLYFVSPHLSTASALSEKTSADMHIVELYNNLDLRVIIDRKRAAAIVTALKLLCIVSDIKKNEVKSICNAVQTAI